MIIYLTLKEQYHPSVKEVTSICEGTYEQQQVLKMELSINRALEHDLNIPTPYLFLQRCAEVGLLRVIQ